MEDGSGFDDALARFQQTALEYGGGLANHGPMAAEALCALGHPALIDGFVDVYAPRLPPTEPGEAIPVAEYAQALGNAARLGDWLATFERLLRERPWREVLSEWCGRLLPGSFAGAGHGVLRVAHAVRALSRLETPVRVRELGFGLAYWAGRYQRLPGVPGARPEPSRSLAATFEGLVPVRPEARRPGPFFEAVRVLDGDAAFRRAVEGVETVDFDLHYLVHELCRIGAVLYLANPQARIAYAHCVTVPSALRLLILVLEPVDLRRACGFALQTSLALHAVSAAGPPSPAIPSEVARLAGDAAEIRYRAACSLEEHAIKLAEACLRENEVRPDPAFRLAAADAAIALDSGGGRGARC